MANRKPTTPESPAPTSTSGLQASVRFIRVGPRKVRLLADQLRGMPLHSAIDQLRFVRKSASAPLEKLLRSAAANLEQGGQFTSKDVTIGSIMVNEGPKLKRYMPRAHGRATTVLQRMSHISVTLKPMTAPAAKEEATATPKKSASESTAPAKKRTTRAKPAAKSTTPTA